MIVKINSDSSHLWWPVDGRREWLQEDHRFSGVRSVIKRHGLHTHFYVIACVSDTFH